MPANTLTMDEPTTAMQNLIQDEAYLLESRGVVELGGEGAAQALQPLLTNSLENVAEKAVLAYVLDEHGDLLADVFVISHQGRLLLECEKSFVPGLLELLSPLCDGIHLRARDCSDQWRVLAELPDQSTLKDGGSFIKYVDPRWHMGARILRPIGDSESYHWGSELKWQGHAHKLGVLPGVHAMRQWLIKSREANLHTQGLIDAAFVDNATAQELTSPTDTICRRVLPIRVEPDAFSFPDMKGRQVTVGGTAIGTVIAHRGLYGLVLVELAPWREAQQGAKPLTCAGQQVLITWPTWLARESRGRAGPVGAAVQAGKSA
jgi:hypothetical protein